MIAAQGPLHLAIIATGLLHDDSGGPEKRGQDLSEANMQRLFAINTIGPTLIAKHVLPYSTGTDNRFLPPCQPGSAAYRTTGLADGIVIGPRKPPST